MSNIFQIYHLKVESLYNSGALVTSNAFAPDAPNQVREMLNSLQTAAIAFDSVSGANFKFGFDVRQIAEDINPTLKAISGIGFALKDRTSRFQSGLLIQKQEAEDAYKKFMDGDFGALLKALEYVRACNKVPANQPLPSFDSIELSQELLDFANETKKRIEDYKPAINKVSEVGLGFARSSKGLVAGGLLALGAVKACPTAIKHVGDGRTGVISEVKNRPYNQTGSWLFHNDFKENGFTHVRIQRLVDRLTPAFADNGMQIKFLTHAQLHDPNGAPNNKSDVYYPYAGYTTPPTNIKFETSAENTYRVGIAEQKFSLVGLTELNEEQSKRARAFLSDPNNRDLPGIELIKLHSASHFNNPPNFKSIEFNNANSSLLVLEGIEGKTPSFLNTFLKETLPALGVAVHNGQVPRLETKQRGR